MNWSHSARIEVISLARVECCKCLKLLWSSLRLSLWAMEPETVPGEKWETCSLLTAPPRPSSRRWVLEAFGNWCYCPAAATPQYEYSSAQAGRMEPAGSTHCWIQSFHWRRLLKMVTQLLRPLEQVLWSIVSVGKYRLQQLPAEDPSYVVRDEIESWVILPQSRTMGGGRHSF